MVPMLDPLAVNHVPSIPDHCLFHSFQKLQTAELLVSIKHLTRVDPQNACHHQGVIYAHILVMFQNPEVEFLQLQVILFRLVLLFLQDLVPAQGKQAGRLDFL